VHRLYKSSLVKKRRRINLNTISTEKLLDTRLCDLPLTIQGTWLETCVDTLHTELKMKGLTFYPKAYLADEWLTPDLEPIVGIPFYLSHPKLMQLEKTMMLEIEGGTRDWCMKLLRHETGHAINYAYRLYNKKKWKVSFGNFNDEYKDIYRFRPYSRNFVRHLEDYYAQYHPDEDFAETFSVWLTPNLDWKTEYKGWKALNKLKTVDQLMVQIKGVDPFVAGGRPYWKASNIRRTLSKHYQNKQQTQAEDFPHFHDKNLQRIFAVNDMSLGKKTKAAVLLRRYRKYILESMGRWTGEKKYVSNDILNKIIARCRELDLVCVDPEPVTMLRISTYLSTLVMNYLYTGRLRGKKWRKS